MLKLFIYSFLLLKGVIGQGQQSGFPSPQFNANAQQGQPQGSFVPQNMQQQPGQFQPPQAQNPSQFGNQPPQSGQSQFPNQQQQPGQSQFGQQQPGSPQFAQQQQQQQQQQQFGQPQPPFGGVPSQQSGTFGGQQPNPLLGSQQSGLPLGIGSQGSVNTFGAGNNPQSPQQPVITGNVAGAPQVVFTADLVPIDRASGVTLRQISWQEPETSPLYCVSQQPTTRMIFSCPTCSVNGTTFNFDEYLARYTQTLTNIAGYPAIKLANMPINGELWNMRTLRCIAFYTDVGGAGQTALQGTPNVTIELTIVVTYLSAPIIKQIMPDGSLRGPLSDNEGNRFFVSQQGIRLICFTTGNPQPAAYQWFMNGLLIGQSNQLDVNAQQVNKAFSCRATNAQVSQGQAIPPKYWEESGVVTLEQQVGPYVGQMNFDDAKKQISNDAVNGKIPLGRTAQLQCIVAALPRPYVAWYQQSAQGHIINATCSGGPRITNSARSTNANDMGAWIVTGSCSVTLDALEKAGDYWCSACSPVADNYSTCFPPPIAVPPTSVNFDLYGPPAIVNGYRVERLPNSERVTVYFTYCSDPPPQANEVYWMIGSDKLTLNNRLDGIQAGPIQQNTSFVDCFDLPLVFESTNALARSNNFQLNIAPAQGQHVQHNFQVDEILANATGGSSNRLMQTAFDPTGLAVGIAVGLFLLVLIIICAFLWYKQKACFAPSKRPPTTTTSKVKPKGSGAKYQSNLAPTQVKSEALPEKVPPMTRPNPDGYPSERTNLHNNGFDPSIPTTKRTHEGLTYSEFDLVKDSTRPPPPGSRPTEYVRMQTGGTANLKSPTNSVV